MKNFVRTSFFLYAVAALPDIHEVYFDRCTLFIRNEETSSGTRKTLECQVPSNRIIRRYEVKGLSETWLEKHKDDIISSQTVLVSGSMEIRDGSIYVRDHSDDNAHTFLESESSYDHSLPESNHHRRQNKRYDGRHLKGRSQGTKETVVVHVKTGDDKQTPYSKQDLSDVVFGTYGDRLNVQTQMDACSYGKLNIVPAKVPKVEDGVYSFETSLRASDLTSNELRDMILDELVDNYGRNLQKTFRHIMICVPKGVGTPFVAYAWSLDYLSVYYDTWCGSVSAQVHEVGHNIGLVHSGEGDCRFCPYGDQSGMMGFTYPESESPRMCFNSAKSWQLGWYDDKNIEVDPLKESWHGQLVGIADYGRGDYLDRFGFKVIAKLISPDDDNTYYVHFNRKTGINEETNEGEDQVLVTKAVSKRGWPRSSNLEAKLNAGESYFIEDFGDTGETVVVLVNAISKEQSPWFADIWITSADEVPPTNPSIKPPTLPPTARPSPKPTPRPSPKPTPRPSPNPTARPSPKPTARPSPNPTARPSPNPTAKPTPNPTTARPSPNPSARPLPRPIVGPPRNPTTHPTAIPTARPSSNPTTRPTSNPTDTPSVSPTREPRNAPPYTLRGVPTIFPSDIPSLSPMPTTLKPANGSSMIPSVLKEEIFLPTADPTSLETDTGFIPGRLEEPIELPIETKEEPIIQLPIETKGTSSSMPRKVSGSVVFLASVVALFFSL